MKYFVTKKDLLKSSNITPEMVVRNNLVLNSYFGIPPYVKKSANQIAKKHGISIRRVRQIVRTFRPRVEKFIGKKISFSNEAK